MEFDSLYKIYYKNGQDEWRDILNKRRESESTISLPLKIREYNRRPIFPSFFMYHPELVQLLLKLEDKKAKFSMLVNGVPQIMVIHLLNNFLSNEIKASNDIEGVHSSRHEIQKAIINSQNTNLRFSSIIAKYKALLQGDIDFAYDSSQEIRDLYDEIIASEVDKADLPDGLMFRVDSVDVVSPTQKIIHRGLLPEAHIIEEMDKALGVLNDEYIQLPIRVAIFHYYFGYIHPFYDGNGRTNRFISTVYLAKSFHPLLALSLSVTVKSHRGAYYDAFKMTTSERNGGDVTTFIMEFLRLLEESIDNVSALLEKRVSQLDEYSKKLDAFLDRQKVSDSLLRDIYYLLLQARLFSSRAGISRNEMILTCKKSRGTIHNRLQKIPKEYLVKVKRGREEAYMLKMSLLAHD